MDKCFKCMADITEGHICPECNFDNNSAEPMKLKHLVPGTVLKNRFLIGVAKKRNSVFTTYIAYDNTKDNKVYLDEFLPDGIVRRAKGRLKVNIQENGEGHRFLKAKKLIVEQVRNMLELKLEGTDILGAFEDNNTVYIIREFTEDIPLSRFIKKQKEMSVEYARHIAVSLINIMKPFHNAGIINGNIRPENIVIDPVGNIRITNFGFYGAIGAAMAVPANDGYSPIEQYRRNPHISEKTDVYSIGAVYYAILSKNRPVSAITRREADTLVPLSTVGIPVKGNIENAVLNALNIIPDNRTATLKDFYDEMKDKNTPRKWERVKQGHKRNYTFLKKSEFWIKTLVIIVVLIMIVSIIGVIKESISVTNKVEQDKTRETEIVTMAVPPKSDK